MSRPVRTRGFSLIELMVALALGALITLGIINMFAGTQKSFASNRGQGRVQENARYALDFMARSLRMTGFLGCVSTKVTVFNGLTVPDDQVPFEARISQPIFSFEATTPLTPSTATDANPGTWSPALNDATNGVPTLGAGAINIATIRPGTDVVVVRSADGNGLRASASQGAANANLVVRAPTAADLPRYAAGSFALVSDCNKSALFQITAATVGGGNLTVQHHSGAQIPGNAVAEVLSPNGDGFFDVDSTLYPLSTEVYYIAPGAGTNNRAAVPWSLWRKSGAAAPVELVEGVHDLQVLYGVDIDADGVPNRYTSFQSIAAADRGNIVTIRMTVGVDSVDEVPTAQGDTTTILNRTFSATVAVRNRVL